MNRRHQDHARDWRGSDPTRPYHTKRPRAGCRETFSWIAFGCAGALFLGALMIYALHYPEIRAALAAWHH